VRAFRLTAPRSMVIFDRCTPEVSLNACDD
jgi:hypothetical protein